MRGHTRKRGKTWAYWVELGPDPATGKRRQQSRGGFARERDARAALNETLTRLGRGEQVTDGRVTVGRFLLDEWLPSRRSKVRESTWQSYRDALEGRVVPRVGGLRLASLTPKHVANLYDELEREGGRDPRRGAGLSARTVRYTGMVLTRALDDAVKRGLIARNPAALVERPKPVAREMRTWTPAQARAFLESVEADRLRALWVLYLTAGLRRGEALGLRWDDLDLDAGRLAVRRALVAVGYRVEWSQPKTERSRRVVAIDRETVGVLRAHRKAQAEERLAIGPGYSDDGLVFAQVDGQPIHPDYVSKTFDRLARAAELPPIRLHDCRHTAATLLLDLGVPLKVVSERLGHSSISITADLYQHVLEHMQADAAELAGAALLGKSGPVAR